jgi:hypothetical protein
MVTANAARAAEIVLKSPVSFADAPTPRPTIIARYRTLVRCRTASAPASKAKRGVDKPVDIRDAESNLSKIQVTAHSGVNRGQKRRSRQEAHY